MRLIILLRYQVGVMLVLLLACGYVIGGQDDPAVPKNKRQKKKKEVVKLRIKEERSGEWTPSLSGEEKETLFAIAHDTLDWCVSGGDGDFFKKHKYKLTPKLKCNYATFVTLNSGGMLRGCIGTLEPVEPLYMSVHNNTVNAAFRDHRFRPVESKELGQIDIHVSILSSIRDIQSLDEFIIGEHGIIIFKGPNRAVYLPEVATEQGWTKDETLSSLSIKAGMDPDAWKDGTSFKVFSSVVLMRDENK